MKLAISLTVAAEVMFEIDSISPGLTTGVGFITFSELLQQANQLEFEVFSMFVLLWQDLKKSKNVILSKGIEAMDFC